MSIPGQMNFSPLTVLQMIAMSTYPAIQNIERPMKMRREISGML